MDTDVAFTRSVEQLLDSFIGSLTILRVATELYHVAVSFVSRYSSVTSFITNI